MKLDIEFIKDIIYFKNILIIPFLQKNKNIFPVFYVKSFSFYFNFKYIIILSLIQKIGGVSL